MADATARQAWIQARPEAGLVSVDLPLRANLSVLENIALGLQYQQATSPEAALSRAWELLAWIGEDAFANHRDPDIACTTRFAAKLFRAAILQPPLIIIDRPAQLLPDVDHPRWLTHCLERLADKIAPVTIIDYTWNAPLWT